MPPLALGAAPPDAVALPPEAVIEPLPELPPLVGTAAEPPVSGSWLAEPLPPQPAATTEEALDNASRKTRREFMLMWEPPGVCRWVRRRWFYSPSRGS